MGEKKVKSKIVYAIYITCKILVCESLILKILFDDWCQEDIFLAMIDDLLLTFELRIDENDFGQRLKQW